jgi:hypothetical protein
MRLNPYGEIVNNSSFLSLRLVRKRQKQQQPKQRAGLVKPDQYSRRFQAITVGLCLTSAQLYE